MNIYQKNSKNYPYLDIKIIWFKFNKYVTLNWNIKVYHFIMLFKLIISSTIAYFDDKWIDNKLILRILKTNELIQQKYEINIVFFITVEFSFRYKFNSLIRYLIHNYYLFWREISISSRIHFANEWVNKYDINKIRIWESSLQQS